MQHYRLRCTGSSSQAILAALEYASFSAIIIGAITRWRDWSETRILEEQVGVGDEAESGAAKKVTFCFSPILVHSATTY